MLPFPSRSIIFLVSRGFSSSSANVMKIAVTTTCKKLNNKAMAFANKNNLQFVSSTDPVPVASELFMLEFGKEKLQYIYYQGKGKGDKMKGKTCFTCDFDDGALQNRILAQSTNRSPLLKALGFSPGDKDRQGKLKLLDATAGLAEDSFLMAHFADHVTVVERSPLLHVILEDGLMRAKESMNYITRHTAEKIKLEECGDSICLFEKLLEQHPTTYPDVVFLDPMHEEKYGKAALPKFKIQLARKLVGRGNEKDHQLLLEKAIPIARQRVVFKRPITALLDPKTTFSVTGGRAVRYDVYITGNT